MKFFHLSDLHIGLRLKNRDLSEDQRYIFDQIADYARKEQPDAVLVAGDLYDKSVPSAEAIDMFDYFVNVLTEAVPQAEIMMISGNHDSNSRVNVFRNVLAKQHVHMIGMPPQREDEYMERVTLTDEYGAVHFYLLPFVKPSMVRLIVGSDENGNSLSYDESIRAMIAREPMILEDRNVLVSHQFYNLSGKPAEEVERMESEVCTVGNIDEVKADVLQCFDYAALGHIHKPMKVGSEVYRYCGTPLACSVDEAGQEKGIIMVEMGEKGSVQTSVLPLKPLREVRVITGTLDEVLTQACNDYVTVILTDQVDLEVMDMQDRVRYAYPYLLELRRESARKADYSSTYVPEEELDTFELCCSFLSDLTEEEKELLQDVINSIQEGEA